MSSELGPAANAIRLEWTFGFNKEISGGVHNLSDSTRRAIFYVAGNVGVITDLDTSEQVLLQGHCNMIGCSCVSQDKHWLVTADHGGDDSMIVIWDSFAGTPKTTIQQPEGVLAVDFSPDARLLATVSKDFPQKFSLWDWQNDEQMVSPRVPPSSTFGGTLTLLFVSSCSRNQFLRVICSIIADSTHSNHMKLSPTARKRWCSGVGRRKGRSTARAPLSHLERSSSSRSPI